MSVLDLIVWGHQFLFKKDILYSNDVCGLSKHIWLYSLLPIIAFRGEDNNVVYLNEMLFGGDTIKYPTLMLHLPVQIWQRSKHWKRSEICSNCFVNAN